MSGPRPRARALAAGFVAGLALWVTRGGLEVVAGPAGPLRVALLPSGWQALSLVAVAMAASLGFAHAVAWLATGNARRIADADAETTRPLLATGVLVLPFLPWLADVWPALTVLASRFALLVWLVAAVLAVRAAIVRVRAVRAPRPAVRLSGPGLIVAAGLVLYGGVAWRFSNSGLFPGGDEPHYLVLAQSLWRDHDFKIENNHLRGDTFEYYRLPLTPHYLVRGTDGEIYSIHPVGLAIVTAPIYAAGGYPGVLAFLIVCAAGTAAGLWVAARRLTGSASAATLAWIGAAASAPFVFNSGTVYPEIPAAACAMAAYLLATRPGGLAGAPRLAIACGLCLAALPWLSSRYSLMMAALGAIALGRLWLPVDAGGPPAPVAARLRTSIGLGVPVLISVAGWMAFFQAIWGSPFPSVVYGTQDYVGLKYLLKGGPGLLFDQEYGILPAAPIFAASLIGLAGMIATDTRSRRVAVEIVAVFVALLIPVGAFHLWSGGSGAIGRPVISAILLLGLPIAWLARRSVDRPVASAALALLAAATIAQMLFLLSAQQGLLLVAGRDGVSRLLEYWSPSWRLWTLAPSFLMQAPAVAWAFTAIWLLAIAGGAVAVARVRRPIPPGTAALAACGVATATLAVVATSVSVALQVWRGPAPQPGARAVIPLLSEFDAQRRPLGVVYDPIRRAPAGAIPPLLRFVAGPQARGDRTGVDLLYDARWSLPAGRYEIALESRGGQPFEGDVGLQVGRVGPPLRSWTIAPTSRWSALVDLPADARFVGIRASPGIAGAGPELRLTPRAITDRRTRRTNPDVMQTRLFGDAAVFFFDERVGPEPTGFWTRGDSTSRLAVALAPDRPTVFRLRAGPRPATVTTDVDGDVLRIELAPLATRDVTLRSRHAVASVAITTEGGFVPAEVEPGARDRRRLGVWVEVIR